MIIVYLLPPTNIIYKLQQPLHMYLIVGCPLPKCNTVLQIENDFFEPAFRPNPIFGPFSDSKIQKKFWALAS